jgi:hypothetical protein
LTILLTKSQPTHSCPLLQEEEQAVMEEILQLEAQMTVLNRQAPL